MSRPLTERERLALRAMIERATGSDGVVIAAQDRQRWLDQAAEAQAGARCACGTCPSIELEVPGRSIAREPSQRVVLEAGSPGAMLLLFIDDDVPSYLELAPIDEGPILEFPPPVLITP